MCHNTHRQHQRQQQHVDVVVNYLLGNWKVIGARDLVDQYGIEVVHAVALEMQRAFWSGAAGRLTNPAGFVVWKCRQLAEAKKRWPDRLLEDLR